MAINLENPFHKDQFNAFVDFASGRDEDTIVRMDALAKGQGLPGLGGKPRSISVKNGDGYAHFWRGGTSRSVNNSIRDLFLSTVCGVCGVDKIEKLPPNVLAVMKADDYDGKGHPLTVRRIRAVTDAVRAAAEDQAAKRALANGGAQAGGIGGVGHSARSTAGLNISGDAADGIANVLLQGSGILESPDPANELQRRINVTSKAMMQTWVSKEIGVNMRTGNGFSFEAKSTFKRDFGRDMYVQINDGESLADLGHEKARDEFVRLVTGDENATYDKADEKTKLKACVLMAHVNQEICGTMMGGLGHAFSPEGNKQRLNAWAGNSGKQLISIKFSKNDNGDIVIKAGVAFTPPMITVFPEDREMIMGDGNVGAYAMLNLDIVLSDASLEKFVNAKWEDFDNSRASEANADLTMPHHLEVAAERLSDDFRLEYEEFNMSYQIHVDKLYEIGSQMSGDLRSKEISL